MLQKWLNLKVTFPQCPAFSVWKFWNAKALILAVEHLKQTLKRRHMLVFSEAFRLIYSISSDLFRRITDIYFTTDN